MTRLRRGAEAPRRGTRLLLAAGLFLLAPLTAEYVTSRARCGSAAATTALPPAPPSAGR